MGHEKGLLRPTCVMLLVRRHAFDIEDKHADWQTLLVEVMQMTHTRQLLDRLSSLLHDKKTPIVLFGWQGRSVMYYYLLHIS